MFSLKINKRGDPNKVRGGRKKIGKLISGRGGGPLRVTRWVNFYFLTFELRKWSWYMKKMLKYYNFNVREPLEIDTTPQISKNLL